MNGPNAHLSLTPALLLTLAVMGCTTASSPHPGVTDVQDAMRLPVTFESVFFRTEKPRVLVDYEATGSLRIDSDALVFNYKDGILKISAETIFAITRGKLPQTPTVWLIVHYTEAGTASIAAFNRVPTVSSVFSGDTRPQVYDGLRAMILPGKTTASHQLERDTFSQLIAIDKAGDKDCAQRRIVGREIVATDSKGAVEHWNLNRCGTLVRYRISYTSDSRGGTMIGWAPAEVIGKAQ